MLLWLFPDCLLGRWPVALGFLMAGPSPRAAAHPPSAPQAVRKSGRAQGIPLGQGVLLGWQEESQVAPTRPQGVVNPGSPGEESPAALGGAATVAEVQAPGLPICTQRTQWSEVGTGHLFLKTSKNKKWILSPATRLPLLTF